jgi:hypothetical protein
VAQRRGIAPVLLLRASGLLTEVPSTTSLDQCQALANRQIRRKWRPLLHLFGSKSDKIGAHRGAFIYHEPLKKDFSIGSLVINEVVLELDFSHLRAKGIDTRLSLIPQKR